MGEELVQVDAEQLASNPVKALLTLEIEGKIIVNKRCKLCTSEYRKEAEEMYASGKSILEVFQFLESKNEGIAYSPVNHHLKEHYLNFERLAFVLDYCDRYEELATKRRAREDYLQTLIDTATVELSRIIMMDTKNNIQNEKVRNDMMLKTISSIRESILARNSMEEGDTALKAMQMKFAKAWQVCIEKAPLEKRQVYTAALQEFQKQMKQ